MLKTNYYQSNSKKTMKIPNILWQTWKSSRTPSIFDEHRSSWKASNPKLDCYLFNDSECDKFIADNFSLDILQIYRSLPQPIMRTDLWRIAIVLINGGFYGDLDLKCNLNLENYFNDSTELVLIKEIDNIANFFIGAVPGHPVIELAFDYMIEEAISITDKEAQSFGMHSLHRAVREYYRVEGTDYPNDDKVSTLDNESMKDANFLIHSAASLTSGHEDGYVSWRSSVSLMNHERDLSQDVLFFTTFNESGYKLYGEKWISSFISTANYYNKFKAKVYHQGFDPVIRHPSIEWVKYEDAIVEHERWKRNFSSISRHSDYVKTMTLRFSHKAFVIIDAIRNSENDYLIWLDGDCVFKNSDYTGFPGNLLNGKTMAFQVEENHDLNHVESGILIFKNKTPDLNTFVDKFEEFYSLQHILEMGEPYDGFIIYKTLLNTGLDYLNLNDGHGAGGIQSDPQRTFLHPEIKNKFIHNIGWTGKAQYQDWQVIKERDDVYQKMEQFLFGHSKSEEIQESRKKLDKLKRMRQ